MAKAALTGDWGRPVNTAAHQRGGIHDDQTATKLGFSGGTVAGSIHMEQFLPQLLATFGESWWAHGVLSVFFQQATMDREPVRCLVSEPDGAGQAQVWMENEAGDSILAGTANLGGCAQPTALAERLQALRPATDLRVLKNIDVGQVAAAPARVGAEFVDQQLQVITAPHDYFASSAKYGRRVLPNTQVVRMFDAAEQQVAAEAMQPFVGLYGGIEVEYLAGPVLEETDYDSTCGVVGLSASPKTEILWRESRIEKDGVAIARMLKMDRILKDSSPLWAESGSD